MVPDYAAYVANGGTLPEARYHAALPGALAAVAEAIWPNFVTDATQEAHDRAVFAVADLIDSPPATSERIGSSAIEYTDVPTVASTIRRHLTGSGLLHRGL